MTTLRGDSFVGHAASTIKVRMRRVKPVVLAVVVLSLIPLVGCQDLVSDKEKLFPAG